MDCDMRTLQGFMRYETDWIKQMKCLTRLVYYLKGWGKTVNSKGKCHQMSELELLQNKTEHFPRDKDRHTNLLELYKSNAWKRDTSRGQNVNINKQSQIGLPHQSQNAKRKRSGTMISRGQVLQQYVCGGSRRWQSWRVVGGRRMKKYWENKWVHRIEKVLICRYCNFVLNMSNCE